MEQVRLKISGQVQGVFFRAETKAQALLLGLQGWVKNTQDGGVEVLVQGEKDRLEKFIEWCRSGPDAARVEHIELSSETPVEKFEDFEIQYE